ncbi:MAG TPA: TonB-dependent receptor [Candidatus Sulfotelmatobacter sp.]|nr:TonB-dependent receptor [Candidatus Sulfotelmatobacter sp.]
MSKAQATLRRLASALIVATFVLGSFLSMRAPALAVGGQTGTLTGIVVNDQHEPVTDATVTAASPSGSYHARTDAKGFFSLLGLPADTYTVSIERVGYQTQTVTGVTILGDQNQNLNTITMSRRVIGRVSVHSPNSAFQPSQTIDQTTLSGQRIAQALGTATNTDERQLLLAAPGVQEDSSGSIAIRGSQGTEIGYQLDGVNYTAPFFDANGGAGLFRTGGYLNGFASGTGGSVQVISGAGDATQGNIGAGVINIIPPRGTYPAGGIASYTFGNPYRNGQYDLDYGIATRNGSISNYLAIDMDDYAPLYAPFGASAASLGEYGGPSAINHSDFLDNLIVRFGKNQNQSVQILYRDTVEDVYGDYGALVPYYNANPIQEANFTQFGFDSSLFAPLPYGSQATTPASPTIYQSSNTHFFKLGYTNALNSTTFLTADWFNWAQDQITNQADTGAFADTPLYEDIGGSRAGFDLNLSHQFGTNHLVTLATRLENDHPRWTAEEPTYSALLLYLDQDAIYGVGGMPSYADFQVPVGGVCPTAGGCYIYDHDGGVPVQIPLFGIDYHGSDFQNYGIGIRDQWTVTPKLKLDYGLREDIANYKWGANPYAGAEADYNPSDLGTPQLGAGFLQPHIIQPRFAAVYDLTPNDALRASYGRSVEFAYGQTGGTPFNISDVNPILNQLAPLGDQTTSPTCGSGFNNTPNVPGAKLNPGIATSAPYAGYFFPCANYAQQLFWAWDQLGDAPDYGGTAQETFSNYDVEYSHQFTKGFLTGWGTKLTGWWRRGFNVYEDVLLSTGPPDPATGIVSGSVFNVRPDGIEKAFGMEFNITAPDRPYGWGGYLTANYLSEFTTVPPACCGQNAQYASDSLPGLVPSLLLTGTSQVYRTNTLPPFNVDTAVSYKTRKGFKITPIFMASTGYPIGVGNETFSSVNGFVTEIPSTNFGAAGPIGGYGLPFQANNAFSYVDPSNPGSYLHPNIAATRGYNGAPLPGGALSNPTDTLNLDLEYNMGQDQRTTIGVYIANVTNNHYGIPYDNPKYQAVATGVAGPQTGQNITDSNPASPFYSYYEAGVRDEGYYNGGPNGAFLLPYNAGINFNFYVQRKF